MSKSVMQDLAKHIQDTIGKKYGFCLLIYNHNEEEGIHSTDMNCNAVRTKLCDGGV